MVSQDNQNWSRAFKKWSPEYCGSVKTEPVGKDFRTLYTRWQDGTADTFGPNEIVHGLQGRPDYMMEGVVGIELCNAGSLMAWSYGHCDLTCTDVATFQTRSRVKDAHGDFVADIKCLAVNDITGLACTGGEDYRLKAWDHRQAGNGPSIDVDCQISPGDPSNIIWCMTSVEGTRQLLTGGQESDLVLWDLRNYGCGPLRKINVHVGYREHSIPMGTKCLAIEPLRRYLYFRYLDGWVGCWDYDQGTLVASLTWPHTAHSAEWDEEYDDDAFPVELVVGKDSVVVKTLTGMLYEWAHPNPQAIANPADDVYPHANLTVNHPSQHAQSTAVTSVLGLGESPAAVLVGTGDGHICLSQRLNQPLPLGWSLGDRPYPGASITCMAAIDQVVVAGYGNGALGFMRMDTPIV